MVQKARCSEEKRTTRKHGHGIRARTVVALGFLAAGCAGISLQAAPLADQSLVAERPEWQEGDRWIFRWRQGLSEGHFTVAVEHAAPGGYTLLTLEEGGRRYFTPDFGYIAAVSNNQITEQNAPPLPLLKFPLTAGKKWEQGGGATPPGSL